jgi:peptidoglycan LD-endopeptidase CwlK
MLQDAILELENGNKLNSHSLHREEYLDLLVSDFRPLVKKLLDNCQNRGVIMIPFQTMRSPFLQAQYWRQSRNVAEVNKVIQQLKQKKANFLVSCIERAPETQGPKITNALPGFSWHQWGEAIDCYWQVNGSPEWDCDRMVDGINGYHIYAEESLKLKLTPGFYWDSIKDAAHVQKSEAASPLSLYSVRRINDIMKAIFTD